MGTGRGIPASFAMFAIALVAACSSGGAGSSKTIVRTVTVDAKVGATRTSDSQSLAGIAVPQSCGSIEGERLVAKGVSCRSAASLASTLKVEGREPAGYSCATDAIICWRDGENYATAATGFELVPEKNASPTCSAAQTFAGNNGACTSADGRASRCVFAGLMVTRDAGTITCADAREIMSAHFNALLGLDYVKPREIFAYASKPNSIRVELRIDGWTSAVWLCRGTQSSPGSCFNQSAAVFNYSARAEREGKDLVGQFEWAP